MPRPNQTAFRVSWITQTTDRTEGKRCTSRAFTREDLAFLHLAKLSESKPTFLEGRVEVRTPDGWLPVEEFSSLPLDLDD